LVKASSAPAGNEARARRVWFIGLTGSIGAGKSEALDAFARAGASTLSSDAVAHEVLETPEIRRAVIERFGSQLGSGEGLDRLALARVVFADPDKRQWLEKLLWPRVSDRITSWRDEIDSKKRPPAAAVVEVPLLFEAQMQSAFDRTVCITAAETKRAERVSGRGQQDFDARASRQLTQDEKERLADFVIANDGTLTELEDKVRAVLEMMNT
jgi:dephospho-CoA kinase